MIKMPNKVRVGISVVLFVWSIVAIIASIYFSQNGLLWTAYAGPILAFLFFILSIIIMPKTRNDSNSNTIEEKLNQHFNSQTSWDYEDDEDDEEWDDDEEEEEKRRQQEEEEDEERRHEEEDEEEFMMYYEDDD